MKKDRTTYFPLHRSEELAIQQLADELLIYDTQTGKAYCLNSSSALVWNACDGTKTIAEISRDLTAALNSEVTEDFVWLALENLQQNELLANGERMMNNFAGISRREVIKRVGLTTAVALPLISALLVPTAAEAASGCLGRGATCPNGQYSYYYYQYPYAPCCSGYCMTNYYFTGNPYFYCL